QTKPQKPWTPGTPDPGHLLQLRPLAKISIPVASNSLEPFTHHRRHRRAIPEDDIAVPTTPTLNKYSRKIPLTVRRLITTFFTKKRFSKNRGARLPAPTGAPAMATRRVRRPCRWLEVQQRTS
ncbi:hypothetical protein E2562_013335, partial [Oryza meyeriana var. granulata]